MTSPLNPRYLLVALTSGIALAFTANPSPAQLSVTGGGARINNADVFVPETGDINVNGVPTERQDTRAVIYNGNLVPGQVRIETNQGNIPASARFRATTLPTIGIDGNGNPATNANLPNAFNGAQGQLQGTLSFRAIGPSGALFYNIPSTLNFSVVAPDTLVGGDAFNEFRAEGFILQETGFAVGAPGVGVVQRRTPVTLVQYQPDGTDPTNQVVLNNPVPGSAYTASREGTSYNAGNIELGFDSGVIFTPPGFTLSEASQGNTSITVGSGVERIVARTYQTSTISIFNRVAIINLPSFDDIIYGDDDDDDFIG
ncbi:MAG: hypothetical protein IGR92_09455, partial [Leptolyngbyaceae cyanobacterium T60_A2020_046]|nr:hypothetical protein [Leptolyngbyaceae cyanobacterium T60_A2020_046]